MSRWSVPIIDSHVHFPAGRQGPSGWQAEYIKRFGQAKLERLREMSRPYSEAWRQSYGFPTPERGSGTVEDTAERWLGEVERYGLAKVVFVTGGGNDALADIIRLHPDKFIGYAHHDPFAPDAAAELRRAVKELGLRGYKVLAPALSGSITDERLYPVWEVCEELGIPVLVHFGILGGAGGLANHININPIVLHDVAKGFPDVPFIVAHFGCGYVRETLSLCWACPNVHIDTSGSNQWVRWMPEELTTKMLFRKYLETIGPERIIFGTDSSWFPRGFAVRYLEDQWRDCCELCAGEEVLRAIFGGNAARLLHLEI